MKELLNLIDERLTVLRVKNERLEQENQDLYQKYRDTEALYINYATRYEKLVAAVRSTHKVTPFDFKTLYAHHCAGTDNAKTNLIHAIANGQDD